MSDNWFTSKFSELMASSHISFPTPPPNIHLGPGPIDVFSTKFDDLYPDDVEAAVDGEVVSKDDLKQKLLNLKKRWDPEQVEFQDECATPPDFSAVAVIAPGEQVVLFATTKEENDETVIGNFTANGSDPSLFEG